MNPMKKAIAGDLSATSDTLGNTTSILLQRCADCCRCSTTAMRCECLCRCGRSTVKRSETLKDPALEKILKSRYTWPKPRGKQQSRVGGSESIRGKR